MSIIERHNKQVEERILQYKQEHSKDEAMPEYLWEEMRLGLYLQDDEYKELFYKLQEPDIPFFDMLVLMNKRDKRKHVIEKEIEKKERSLPAPPEGCRYNIDGQLRRHSKTEYKKIYQEKFANKSLWDLYAEHDRLQEQYTDLKFERMFEVKIEAIKELIRKSKED